MFVRAGWWPARVAGLTVLTAIVVGAIAGVALAEGSADQGGGPAPAQIPPIAEPPATEPPTVVPLPDPTAPGSPGPAASLVGPTWQLAEIRMGAALVPALPAPEVTLRFAPDGAISGSAGCNGFGGGYRVEGHRLTFERVVSTLRACADASIMAQEQIYLTALRSTTDYSLAGDTLTLLDGSGAQLAVLRAA